MSYRRPLVRTVAFVVLAAFLGTMTWRLLAGAPLPSSDTYQAAFTDVSDLKSGDRVRIAGVDVGKVDHVAVDTRNHRAVVTFGISKTLSLTDETWAQIKYKNLTGDRYLALTAGIAPVSRAATGTDLGTIADDSPQGRPLHPGAMLPISRTTPALDLDALFGGFQPLFQALNPQQINQLSGDLVQALQGEGGTVMALLRDVADFTTTLADRDAVIGQVVTNLNSVLGALTDHSADLGAAIDQAQLLATGLAQQRRQLADGLVATTGLTDQLANTLRVARPDLVRTSGQVQRLSELLTTQRNSKVLTERLSKLPAAYHLMFGFGSYGAWSNFYMCGLSATLDTGQLPMAILPGEPRCQF